MIRDGAIRGTLFDVPASPYRTEWSRSGRQTLPVATPTRPTDRTGPAQGRVPRFGRSGTRLLAGTSSSSPSSLGARRRPEGGLRHPTSRSVFARGLLKHAVTRLYFPDEVEANAADPVLSRLDEAARSTLVAVSEQGGLRFDIRLQGPGHTTFFAV